MRRASRIWIAAVAAVGLGLSACGGDDSEELPPPPSDLTVPGEEAESDEFSNDADRTRIRTIPSEPPAGGAPGSDTGTTTTPSEEPAPPPPDDGGSGGGSTGDSPKNDSPPPPGSPAERFEQRCKKKPQACS